MSDHHLGQVVVRPWGQYQVIDQGFGFYAASSHMYKIKTITIEPGKSISLQYHLHRKEIWTVLHGAGKAKIGGEKRIILEGDTVTVPVGVVHKLSNPGKTKLIILESQMGSYCEEDDIVRLNKPTEVVTPDQLPEEKK